MIYISRNSSRQYLAINRNKRLYFNDFRGKSFIPQGKKFQPFISGARAKVNLVVTNKLTKAVTNIELFIEGENNFKDFVSTNRYTLYYFDYNNKSTIQFDEKGKYTYEIVEYIADASLNKAGEYFVTDRGELRIFNDNTFTDPYINPDEQIIPETIVYQP